MNITITIAGYVGLSNAILLVHNSVTSTTQFSAN
jgi:UDP-glucose 6-dehydrogenase